MARLAYLFPPLTGLLSYALGRDERARWHGLQSVVFGFVWPLAIYAGSVTGPLGTRLVVALGVVVWIAFFVLTLFGRDPRMPGGRRLRSLSGS